MCIIIVSVRLWDRRFHQWDAGRSRRAAAGRVQLLAKRERTGRMQFPEKTAGIRDGSGWFRILEEKIMKFGEIPAKFR